MVRAPNAKGVGEYYVLEDNLRVPSGVSYMLEDRKMMMRLFPELFGQNRVAPVAHYPDLLLETLRAVAPASSDEPTVVVLTPGMHNSAYFEHAFLAQQMGVELVEGQDLFVKDDFVYMRTTRGPQRVDVIYRRVDDDFLDPNVFRANSTLGCAGLMDAYRAGNVNICNAVGTGVADDKSIYPYVPKMIEFYLGEKPILNNVPTYMGRKPDDLKYILDNLKDLVVKEVHGAGGYGMLVGPASTKAEIEDFRKAIMAKPDGYIGQPTLSLVHLPHLCGERYCAAPHRPAALCAVWQRGADGARWLDACGAQRGLAGGELVARWRHQGHLDSGEAALSTGGIRSRCLLPATLHVSEGDHMMLSRTADHLFWMSRYTERAENTARIAGCELPDLPVAPVQPRSAGRLGRAAAHQRADARLYRKIRRRDHAAATCWTSWCAMKPIRPASSPAFARRGKTPGPCAAR